MEFKSIKEKFIQYTEIDIPKKYLSDEENQDVIRELDGLAMELHKKIYLDRQGIAGYDDKEKRYYRKNIDITNEELNLLIQMENHQYLKKIKTILSTLYLIIMISMYILAFFNIWPTFIIGLVMTALYFFKD